MYDALDPGATDRALQHRIDNPPAPRAPKVSIWGQAGELIASPFKGVGQAVQETTRVVNTVAPLSVGNPLAMGASEQEELLGDSGITRQAMDQDLRRGIQALRPDPVTSTVASQVLQGAARVVTKAVGYGLVAGPAGAVVGTGIDEGVTGAQELMDRGVDPGTAAKAGAVRGVTMGASVALPVVGQTIARTAGLVAVGGPGAFVAEQALTREILGRAGYADIAAEYDPWDPVGLGLSVAIPGAVGVALHRARITKASKAADKTAEPPSEARVVDEIAQDPDVVDAALVAHRSQSVLERALGDMTDPPVAAAHTRALDAAMQALDEGAPVRIADAVVDPAVASRAMADLDARLAAVRAEIDAPVPDLTLTPPARLAEPVEPVTTPMQPEVPPGMADSIVDRVREAVGVLVRGTQRAEPQQAPGAPQRQVAPEVQRAQELANRMPDMPVRMDDDGSTPVRAADLMEQSRQDAQRDSAEARKAFEAAVTCFLETAA